MENEKKSKMASLALLGLCQALFIQPNLNAYDEKLADVQVQIPASRNTYNTMPTYDTQEQLQYERQQHQLLRQKPPAGAKGPGAFAQNKDSSTGNDSLADNDKTLPKQNAASPSNRKDAQPVEPSSSSQPRPTGAAQKEANKESSTDSSVQPKTGSQMLKPSLARGGCRRSNKAASLVAERDTLINDKVKSQSSSSKVESAKTSKTESTKTSESKESSKDTEIDPNSENLGYHLMSEEELLLELNDEGSKIYESLSPDGKKLAIEVASQRCGGTNSCKGLNACATEKNSCAGKGECKGQTKCGFSDKNLAIKVVAEKMKAKRAEATK